MSSLLGGLSDKAWDFIEYCNFKETCIRDQEEFKWKLDVNKAQDLYEELMVLKSASYLALKKVMPAVPTKAHRKQPKNEFKADGTHTAIWLRWIETCEEYGEQTTSKGFEVNTGYQDPNPDSSKQVKDWLFSLGWSPTTFSYKRSDNGEVRAVPQVRKNGELCDSVKELIELTPSLRNLEGYTVVGHRVTVVKAFLECYDEGGYLEATAHGYTNTMRFTHGKPLVNLPGIDKAWGKDIRGCLTCEDDEVLLGCDMVSLEDTTSRHYQQPYDPEYVKQRSEPDFDPHLDLARFCGAITHQDYMDHQSGVKDLKALRKGWKVTNYSATYGIQAESLSRSVGCTVRQAQAMLDGFWERNHSILKVADACKIRRDCLLNPVSGFYYKLRNIKDKFSTLNQSTGVWCFDTFVSLCKSKGLRIVGQFHDEIIAVVKVGEEESASRVLEESIKETNEILQLNIELAIDYSFGKTYADIH